MTTARRLSGDYADYMVNHERKPGIGPLRAGAARTATEAGRGAPNPDQLERYIENGGFFSACTMPDEAPISSTPTGPIRTGPIENGHSTSRSPHLPALLRTAAQVPACGAKGMGSRQPPEHVARADRDHFDPLPFWYPPFRGRLVDGDEYPLHAITQRPAAMYHSWGSQNAWLRQIHGENPLYVPGACDLRSRAWRWRLGLVSRITGASACQVRAWTAVNGRRCGPGTPSASARAPGRSTRMRRKPRAAFLLNHLIHELLPPKGDGCAGRIPIRSPVRRPGSTCGCRSRRPTRPAGQSLPDHQARAEPGRTGPANVAFGRSGEARMTSLPNQGTEKARPGHRSRHLRRLPCLCGPARNGTPALRRRSVRPGRLWRGACPAPG
jgi:hypothetical protein